VKTKIRCLAFLAVVMLIAGCGQKRDLVLPDPAPASSETPASTESAPKDSFKS
jgi:predicted small lipoprotein YifL